MLDSVFSQLSSYSLDELEVEKPEDVSWKDADGLHFQLIAYALLGVYDITCSHFAEQLGDDEQSARASGCIMHIVDCHKRVQDMLSSASRTKRLRGAMN